MSNNAADLFNVRSHNPSFFSVRESAVYNGPLLDFCIPVNLHFPPPQLVQRITERLPELLRYYPDSAEVHAKHIGDLTDIPPEYIVPANGSTEIITRPCHLTRGPGRKLRDRLLNEYGLMVRECSNKIGSSERYLRLAVQTRESVDLLIAALLAEL